MAQILLHTITWKQDSPYGTYLQDDIVTFYWDDVALDIVVKNNGVTITSGDDIPIVFTYNGNPSFYYKTEVSENANICNGTTKVQFVRGASYFPYHITTLLTNHPSCDLSPSSL